jgi:DNA-binding LacI/PurR family transcriptional regulator
MCLQYIDRRVSGVFFAPLEQAAHDRDVNVRIVDALDAAGIPVVLLDRDALPYPSRGPHDLVGIDNRRAGYVITDHLLQLGSRRVAFVAVPEAPATIDAREAGYREALYARNSAPDRALTGRLDPSDAPVVQAFMHAARPDAVVCGNDRTAARLMPVLLRLGYAIPTDVRLVGIDDAEYARLLPVPLTTLRQPSQQIGEVALGVMLERVARADFPARDVLLHCELIVRESCGASGAFRL